MIPDKKKFIILTRKRTGSTMLRTALNSHPSIRCLGEIFRIDRPLSEREKALKAIRNLTGLHKETPAQVDNYIRDDSIQFFNTVLARNPKLKAFGCKIFLRHCLKFVHDISRNEDALIIVLKRSNTLATYSSQLIANATGTHITMIGNDKKACDISTKDDPDRIKVDFSNEQFDAYRNWIRKSDMKTSEILQGARCKRLDIEYVELLQPNPFRKTLESLSMEPDIDLQPGTRKTNKSNILLRFNNPDTVIQYLEQNELTKWAEEG